MNKILLNQALKFKDDTATNAQIKALINSIKDYQEDNEVHFLDLKYRKKPKITNKVIFFDFLSEINGVNIRNFEDIEYLLAKTTSRKENIEKSGNSKENYTKVFDKVVVFQYSNNCPVLYKNIKQIAVNENKKILAVENGETFLNIYNTISKFGFEQFVYLSGFPNNLTKDFLKDKDVVFFLDYDIEAIRIYDSVECKSKHFFKHPNIENLFSNKKLRNQELYKKQVKTLPKEHNELQWLIKLIKDNSGVIEQEIFS